MKKLLLLSFCLVSICGYSQKTKEQRQAELDRKKAGIVEAPAITTDSLNYPVKYCMLLATNKFFSKDVSITIDYGQKTGFFEDTRIRDKNGRPMSFNSIMDALNYMNSLGWEFVNSYAIATGDQNVYHYLLKANNQTDFDFIPKTKKDFKPKSNN